MSGDGDYEDDGSGQAPPNNTLDGLLRKLEDGNFINEGGADLQAYIKDLRVTARKRKRRVVGKVVIELTIPMGQDGYMLPTAKLTTKPIAKPARPESTIYVDEDGDINGLPVPKQTSIYEVKGGKNINVKDPAAAPVKAM